MSYWDVHVGEPMSYCIVLEGVCCIMTCMNGYVSLAYYGLP